jgi:hypothetical protein
MALGETPALLNLRMPSPSNGSLPASENGDIQTNGRVNGHVAGRGLPGSLRSEERAHINGSLKSIKGDKPYNTTIRHGFEQQYESEQFMNLLAEVRTLRESGAT